MPFDQTTDLPDRVTNVLSERAQDIYLNAYNSAWDDFKGEPDRPDANRDEVAHDFAWGAVKETYEKGDNNKWHTKLPVGRIAILGLGVMIASAVGTGLYLLNKSAATNREVALK